MSQIDQTNESNRINSMFVTALRTKLRFQSTKGELSVEQLWELPLRGNGDFNLDSVAKATNKALNAASEESFVETRKTTLQGKLELALDIVKFVINTKLGEEEAAKRRAENKVEKEKLLKILAEKQDGKLSEMSEKELQRRIAALDD